MICRHCFKGKVNRPRGLCWRCFYTPGVRQTYGAPDPATAKFAPHFHKREPTAAEVEALVAEQSRPENLPAWWARDTGRD